MAGGYSIRIVGIDSGRHVPDMPGGDWFGDFAAIDGLPRSADVVALENTFLAFIFPDMFRRLLHEYPAVCDRVLLRLVAEARRSA